MALCKFTFPKGTSRALIEEAVARAIFTAECIHGTARVRLEAKYHLPDRGSWCLIDTSTEVGEHVAQVFTGIITRRLGEETFRVERVSALEGARS